MIRHNGTGHLRSAALDLTRYQSLVLDFSAFLILLAIAVLVSYLNLKKFCLYLLAKRYNSLLTLLQSFETFRLRPLLYQTQVTLFYA